MTPTIDATGALSSAGSAPAGSDFDKVCLANDGRRRHHISAGVAATELPVGITTPTKDATIGEQKAAVVVPEGDLKRAIRTGSTRGGKASAFARQPIIAVATRTIHRVVGGDIADDIARLSGRDMDALDVIMRTNAYRLGAVKGLTIALA